MLEYKVIQSRIYQTLPQTPRRAAAHLNMVFTQGRGFVTGASFGLRIRSLRCRVLVCRAADTRSLRTNQFLKLDGLLACSASK